MEGTGVTNYALDKPSYAYSTATTEFDDALIQRGIVTHTQAMAAKGASLPEAERLTRLQQQEQHQMDKGVCEEGLGCGDKDCDDDSFEDEDDGFMDRYRRERLEQLQQVQQEREQGRRFGQAVFIDRTQWTREVNDASQQVWVVVCLTSSEVERTGCMEEAIKELAQVKPASKFVLIPSHQAIPDWPHTNLPSLFLYRHGKLQQQLLHLPCDISCEQLNDIMHPGMTEENAKAQA